MKTRKILALLLAALMMLSLAACGPKDDANPTNTPTGGSQSGDDQQSAPKSYQFIGAYEEGGDNAAMLDCAFKLELNEDGTAVADRYMMAQGDHSPADSNPTYTKSYLSGTWKAVQKDGVDCLQIKLAYVNEDGTEANNQTCYAYDVAGVYSFDMTFPVVPGMSYSRIATMEGKAEKTYATADDFLNAYKRDAAEFNYNGGEGGEQTPAPTEEQPTEGGDAESEGIATYEAGGLQLILLDDTNMKVKFPQYSMEREGFTYVLDGNKLTVTAPDDETLGAFAQIWGAMGGENWTIDGNTATKVE